MKYRTLVVDPPWAYEDKLRMGSGVAPRGRHSAKPEAFYDMVESMSPGPYLDVFARRQRLGWDTWGNECFTPEGMSL